MATTAIATVRPGNRITQGALNTSADPADIIPPQLGTGGCAPSPKKPSVASRMMASPVASIAETSTGASVFGNRWRNRICPFPAPSDRAASMKVSPFRVRICDRVRRVNCARYATEIAIIVPVVPGPMMATRISAIRISGKDQVRSTTAETTRSNMPPK